MNHSCSGALYPPWLLYCFVEHVEEVYQHRLEHPDQRCWREQLREQIVLVEITMTGSRGQVASNRSLWVGVGLDSVPVVDSSRDGLTEQEMKAWRWRLAG